MAKYFTAYRIDHILGFFRIWELPDHAATGLVGKFRPSIALSQVLLRKQVALLFPSHKHVLPFLANNSNTASLVCPIDNGMI
jgi:4-alpha-glucanotransferase